MNFSRNDTRQRRDRRRVLLDEPTPRIAVADGPALRRRRARHTQKLDIVLPEIGLFILRDKGPRVPVPVLDDLAKGRNGPAIGRRCTRHGSERANRDVWWGGW